jgi:hypothetical protein
MTPGEFNIDFCFTMHDFEKPWGVIMEFLTKRTTEIVCLKKYG